MDKVHRVEIIRVIFKMGGARSFNGTIVRGLLVNGGCLIANAEDGVRSVLCERRLVQQVCVTSVQG